ncbi:Pleckstrin y domain-containing family G member 2 [Vanrija pseudolonga]|uniref:Pleckstrin y domain-containing family G member 2 n=1 Tax=Vanrija pseudolonga TaxID=143232 RepID=A0AAF0YKD9_9TREE|nr:Pleckstrin y domain-containing family G member 2 [Vanrija pseudolonga]
MLLMTAGDAASFISDPSQFSPSATSKSLPSTKTSLSRSARSGREGSGDIDVDLASGQQSKVQLDKRRMILLEIVETEVTYVRDLRALVHIYLPQLAALPHVSERIHQLIVRNTAELLDFHIGLVGHMVDILKFSGLSYESSDAHTIDTVTKGLADLFVSEGTSFALYNDYCAGSTAAAALVRTIAHRSDYEAFEKRCQIISSSAPHATLLDILTNQQSTPLGSRLRFRDILITPVQRVCRYPLLLASLLADVNRDQPMSDVVAAVEAAQVSMRAVAENADDARRRKEAELKTATVAERIETHPVLTRNFLGRLGTCRLIGALDVLYHHSADSKVRYLAAFLYRGYIILAKVQKARGTFEPKHYLPLEVFELADIKKGENIPRASALTSGILPHTIRMSARDHHFDLAASCETEKDVWMAEMTAARNESTVPPFELPSSVALYSVRSRHSSTVIAERPPQLPPVIKRHTVFGLEELSIVEPATPEDSCFASPEAIEPERPQTPPGYHRLQSGQVLLRRTSMSQRLLIDRALIDVMSETLSTTRSRVMAQSIPDAPPLRRQRSIASLADLVSSPELRSVLLPNRTRSRSAVRASRLIVGDGGIAVHVDGEADLSRNNSFASLTDAPPKRHSSVSLRRGVEAMTPSRVVLHRKSTSLSSGRPVFTLNRASSLPSSPAVEAKVIRDDGSDRAPADAERTETLETLDDDDKTDAKSDGDFVIVPDNLPEPAPQHTPKRASTLKRSLSFFARKGLTPLDTVELPQDFGPRSAGSSGGSPHLTVASAPSTPFGSPQPLKRRRSVRLFGQLRGFTPI